MATAHLIHGFLGVGKTTFARQLEERLPAIRFSHDEWMARRYGMIRLLSISRNSTTGFMSSSQKYGAGVWSWAWMSCSISAVGHAVTAML